MPQAKENYESNVPSEKNRTVSTERKTELHTNIVEPHSWCKQEIALLIVSNLEMIQNLTGQNVKLQKNCFGEPS